MTGKPCRNQKLKQKNPCQVGKSSTKSKVLRKPLSSRKPKKNSKSASLKLCKIPRNGDNGDMDGIQAQQGCKELNFVSLIEQECIVKFNTYSKLSLENVAGLEMVKEIIKDCLILPAKRPDLFKGLKCPVKGVLLFGPSGTGKTLLGKCIAAEMKGTFFNVSPTTLTSKWMGESEKLIRTLFCVAKSRQPSIVFIDNIDCILSSEKPPGNGTLRGIANEFLLQMDNTAVSEDERIVILGATTKPQDLKAAALRRFEVKLQVPLLDEKGRKELLHMFLEKEYHCLEEKDLTDIARKTYNYSGADLKMLCHEAAFASLRSIPERELLKIQPSKVRPIAKEDFNQALSCVKSSTSKKELKILLDWNKQFGHKCTVKRKADDEC